MLTAPPPELLASALTAKQIRFAESMAAGLTHGVASKLAGYTSKASSYKASINPLVKQYIAAIRSESRAIVAYDLATAMEECLEVIAFAKTHENAMAYCKAVELRAKLSGLLQEHVVVTVVDLSGALAKAEARVLNVIPACTQTAQAQPQAEAK